jgi:membrane protein DedA with SNARE-associated domain
MDSLSPALGGLLAGSNLAALFLIILLKEIGVPVPVPSDLLMISAGVQAATGRYPVPALVVALEIAVFIGCSLQFLLVRGAGRRAAYRFGRLVGLPPARLDQAAARLQRRGALAVFLGLNVPGVRAGIIMAAGLAGIRYLAFAPAMIAGSTLYYGWHIALGYVVGPTAATLLQRVKLPLAPVVLALAALGLIGWLLLRGRRKVGAGVERGAMARLHAWTEAACPACLAITALEQRLPDDGETERALT